MEHLTIWIMITLLFVWNLISGKQFRTYIENTTSSFEKLAENTSKSICDLAKLIGR